MLATAAIAAAVLVALVAVGVVVRRQRRQLTRLRVRLEQLEAELDELAQAPALDPPAPVPPLDAASGDVLAGHTSRVRRLLAHGVGDAPVLAEEAIVGVFRRLGEPLAPAGLAEELCVSLRTLERGLALALQCTPRQLILAVKMREAKRLLSSGRHRVGEVATRLGYSTPSHFSRRFREFYHRAPSDVVPATVSGFGDGARAAASPEVGGRPPAASADSGSGARLSADRDR